MVNGKEIVREKYGERLFWDQLLQFIAEGRVVPIIGRDLLTVNYQGVEVQLYPFLAQLLAEYLGVPAEELPEGDELNTIACRYLEKDKDNHIEDVYSALKTVMPGDEKLSIPIALTRLASIRPFKLFVTTTFDSLIERAVNQERFAGQSRTKVLAYTPNAMEDLPAPLEKLDRPVIFHLLGKLSATPAYAVTQEDVLEFFSSLQSENRQPQKLFDVLSRSNLLFLGCNFGDWLARFFIRTAKRQRLLGARGSIDYVADRSICCDSNLVIFLRHFSSCTKIYPGGGVSEFIEKLHQRWLDRYPKPQDTAMPEPLDRVTDDFVKSGAVFLSYASEDLDAARRIRDDLEAEVEVFFDKHELQPGDDWKAKLILSIQKASLFIPVISKNTLGNPERRFFRREWEIAIEEASGGARTESFIIPVVIDGTPIADPSLPEVFRQRQWVRLPGGEKDDNFVLRIKDLYRRYQKTLMGAR
jgi:hypothetical protein